MVMVKVGGLVVYDVIYSGKGVGKKIYFYVYKIEIV